MKGILIGIVLSILAVGIPVLYIKTSHPAYKKSVVRFDPKEVELKYRKEKVEIIKSKVGDNPKVLSLLDKLKNILPKEENNKIVDQIVALAPDIKEDIEALRIKWEPDPKKVEIGKNYYKNYCMTCHGVEGDSLPVTPEGLQTDLGYPIFARDFTGKYHREGKVVFKFASPFLGEMAADEDLIRIIREGLPGTPMPGFPTLTDTEISYILEYIKSLNPRWKFYKGEKRNYPEPPTDLYSEERINRGRETFLTICVACHRNVEKGEEPLEQPLAWLKFDKDGRILKDGDSPVFQSIKARYFGKEPLRRGSPSEIFVTISEGIAGTTMTPWKHLGEEKIWDLVAYIIYLQKGGARNASR